MEYVLKMDRQGFAATSETSARAGDHEMEDAATSNPGAVFLIPFLVD